MLSGGNGLPATGRPPRIPNGTSTTTECEWSAAIGASRPGRAVGITPIGHIPVVRLPDQPASITLSASSTTSTGRAHEPGNQDQARQDARQHRRLLIGEQGRAEDQSEDGGPAAAWGAAQQDRRRQRQRQ